jgi:ribosome-associated protein
MSDPVIINPSVTLPGKDLSWTAVRASGPGGQNVNKVSSKIELRFDLAATSALDPATKARLRAAAASRIDAEGKLLITSQASRDQRQNLEDARDKLRSLVLAALVRPKKRRPTKPSRGATQRRLDEKQRQGSLKRQRSSRDDS